MKNFIDFMGAPPPGNSRKLMLALGVFDGVHLGHRKIVGAARDAAARTGALPAALTFLPHPRAILSPGREPELLISLEERIRRLRLAGAEYAGVIRFDREIAAWEPGEFLTRLTDTGMFEPRGVCVGEHWRFGRLGVGDREFLDHFCRAEGWTFCACPELELDGEVVSSSAIRRAVAAGDLSRAEAMLGYAPQLSGSVEHGFQIAGTRLNAPTANLAVRCGVIPPDGVYAAETVIDGERFPVALNIGFSPTFQGTRRRVEAHIIGFSGRLYDRELTVGLLRFIRPEQRFASPELLKARIAADLCSIRDVFAERNPAEESQRGRGE